MSEAHGGHLATRRCAGLFDFSFMGLHEFESVGELEPLQSRDLARLAPGRIAYTLLLEADGRVFNDATVWRHRDGRWWLFSGRPDDARWIGARSRPRTLSGEHAIVALQGPASGRILARVAGNEAVASLRYFDCAALRVAGLAAEVGRIGYSGELGYEILVRAAQAPALRHALLEAGAVEGLAEHGFAVADSLRIEAGYVLFDREINGRERPAELGLARLVERRRAEREPAQRLVGLRVDAPPGPGARPWLPAARLTSECASPLLECTLGLGFVGAADAVPGARVALGDGRLATVARLPFYDPARRRPRATPL